MVGGLSPLLTRRPACTHPSARCCLSRFAVVRLPVAGRAARRASAASCWPPRRRADGKATTGLLGYIRQSEAHLALKRKQNLILDLAQVFKVTYNPTDSSVQRASSLENSERLCLDLPSFTNDDECLRVCLTEMSSERVKISSNLHLLAVLTTLEVKTSLQPLKIQKKTTI